MEAALTDDTDLGSLERLGDSFEFGSLLLQLLETPNAETGDPGWTIYIRRAFAGDGVLLIGTHPLLDGVEVKAEGASVAAAAVPFFNDAVYWRHKVRGQTAA
jgi:hypothetical protein